MQEFSRIPLGELGLHGQLCTVSGARGLVVFVHANGSQHIGRSNLELARRLQQRELSTLLPDLLNPAEAVDAGLSRNIDLLTQRVLQALHALPADWHKLPIGLFGSGVGSAAALVAQTHRPRRVAAIVSRGGLVDLAASALGEVSAPTLLIVGAADTDVLERNRRAYALLRCEKRIAIVPRASHLFLEAGALDDVAQLAGDWFCAHLGAPAPGA